MAKLEDFPSIVTQERKELKSLKKRKNYFLRQELPQSQAIKKKQATLLSDSPMVKDHKPHSSAAKALQQINGLLKAFAHEEEKEEGAVESDVALDCFQIGSSRSGH